MLHYRCHHNNRTQLTTNTTVMTAVVTTVAQIRVMVVEMAAAVTEARGLASVRSDVDAVVVHRSVNRQTSRLRLLQLLLLLFVIPLL